MDTRLLAPDVSICQPAGPARRLLSVNPSRHAALNTAAWCASVLLFSACSPGSHVSGSRAPETKRASSRAASPDLASACRLSSLRAKFGGTNGLTGGTELLGIALYNRSSTACRLVGTPHVAGFDRAGRRVRLVNGPLASIGTYPAASPVTLTPRNHGRRTGSASLIIGITVLTSRLRPCPRHHETALSAIRLSVPGAGRLTVTLPSHSRLTTCEGRIDIAPFSPGDL